MNSNPEPPGLNIEYIFYKIYTLILGIFGLLPEEGFDWSDSIFVSVFWVLCLLFTVLFFMAMFYFVRKTSEFRKAEQEKYFGKEAAAIFETGLEEKNRAWEEVLSHLNSDNQANWKLAIIEADKMLDEALSALGYVGMSVGDKLKAIPPGFLSTIDEAWTAHKVRNQIAHEPNFDLSEREAKAAINQYERVFRELELI